ncbi:MAG: hypothetical protein Q7P63_09790 [Verrucomicrobiota bacterium JB022]|nr:hypothetical protein [Verrucomicrobiota bacterium JB022]
MPRCVRYLMILAGLCLALPLRAAEWRETQDLPTVLQEAQAKGRYVYLAFLGLEWSVASRKWWQEVGQQPEFLKFADERMILVLANGTARKLPKEEEAAYQALVQHYDVQAYPAFYILAPDGSVLLQHGTTPASPAQYLQALDTLLVPLSPQ